MARAKKYLRDANIERLALCKVGANRQRIFLLKSGDGEPETHVPAVAPLIKEPGEDWRTAYVPVAVPDVEEDQGIFGTAAEVDVWESADEIAKAAHGFMYNGASIVAKHFEEDVAPGVKLVENAVALADFKVGDTVIKEGTWYVGLEFDGAARELVAKGEIDAVSIEGWATRVAKDASPTDTSMGTIVHDDSYGPLGASLNTVNLDAIPAPWDQELCECMAWCEGRDWAQNGTEPTPPAEVLAKVERVAKDAILVPNKPGVTNWVQEAGGLPKFIANIAGDLISERGKTTGKAIQLAVGIVRNWCHGHGGNVSVETRSKACAAAAEWEAKKARSHVAKQETWDTMVDVDEESKSLWRRIAKAVGVETDDDCGCDGYASTEEIAKRAFTAEKRKQLADKGHALPDGSYPIENVGDLHNAIKAHGRAKNKPAVVAHIKKRAKALKSTHMLPDAMAKADDDGTLDADPGTFGDMDRADVEQLIDSKLEAFTAEDGPIAKAIKDGLAAAKPKDDPAEPVAKEDAVKQLVEKVESLAEKFSDFEDDLELVAKSIEELQEGESVQPEPEVTPTGNGHRDASRVAKTPATAGILFPD